ncbi:MAG: hypothetical protein R3E90_12980 [Marinicella sp.]|nr:hypothetical protein [Xanthomonadales bacterium]
MKKLITVLMMLAAVGSWAAENETQKAGSQVVDIETIDVATIEISLETLLAYEELPPIVVNPPTCYGYAPLCNLLISMLEAGRTDIPSGCHYSGAPSSDVYYCEIK